MNDDVIIRVEGLSKQYRLGQIGGTTLREDVSRWWARLRGLPDPTLRVDQVSHQPSASVGSASAGSGAGPAGPGGVGGALSQTPSRAEGRRGDPGPPTSDVRPPTSSGGPASPTSDVRPPSPDSGLRTPDSGPSDRGSARSDYLWALRDVSFEVKRGEVLGIIGRNGAGKSTLLKILSRITAPTAGQVKVKGRIASLLEIGTGMHPELTGRENIFLNGAILGMTKAEIQSKLDEIIDFSGVERFIDTPVKRYSSGMMVRLGFAVAAHLEPEILIVDEVLAVGDAEFQRKCLGKMQDVADHGRTVLFVSHNMGSITRLCREALLLDCGTVVMRDEAEKVVHHYFLSDTGSLARAVFSGPLARDIAISRVAVAGRSGTGIFAVRPSDDVTLVAEGHAARDLPAVCLTFSLFCDGVQLLTVHDQAKPAPLAEGVFRSSVRLPRYLLRPGAYQIGVGGHSAGPEWFFGWNLASLHVVEAWDESCDPTCLGIVNVPHSALACERVSKLDQETPPAPASRP